VSDDAADRHAVPLVVVSHHLGLAEDVVAGPDLLQRRLIHRRSPNPDVIDDLHRVISFVVPVGIEPTSS
jgi:hypothetical protein